MKNNSDLRLLRAQFLEGNNSFLEEASFDYGRYCIRVLISRYSCSNDLGSEIFTDVLLNFRERILKGQLTEVKNIKTYLTGACLNAYKEYVRKEIKKKERQYEAAPFIHQDDTSGDGSSLIEMKQVAVMTALEDLSENCQNLIRLFYVDKLKMEVIARQLGLKSDKVAKTLKSRCYQKWIALVNKYVSESDHE